VNLFSGEFKKRNRLAESIHSHIER
jgi:hypothetical protein